MSDMFEQEQTYELLIEEAKRSLKQEQVDKLLIEGAKRSLKYDCREFYFARNIMIMISITLFIICTGYHIFSVVNTIAEESKIYDSDNIVVEEGLEQSVKKVDIIDEYVKDGTTYYEVVFADAGEVVGQDSESDEVEGTFNFISGKTQDDVYTYSEKEYEAIFGSGNTAIDAEEYTLHFRIALVEYDTKFSIYWPNKKVYWHNRLVDIGTDSRSNCYLRYYDDESGEELFVHAYIFYDLPQTERVMLTCDLSRYNYLGDKEFAEEEIEHYRDIVNVICEDLMNSLYNKKYESQFAWE